MIKLVEALTSTFKPVPCMGNQFWSQGDFTYFANGSIFLKALRIESVPGSKSEVKNKTIALYSGMVESAGSWSFQSLADEGQKGNFVKVGNLYLNRAYFVLLSSVENLRIAQYNNYFGIIQSPNFQGVVHTL
jgi:hypothetical protein